MAARLTAEERRSALAGLPRWTVADGREAITRTFAFRDFAAAFAWMTKVAEIAERMNHHPEWSNVYRTVTVTLATHDAGGLTGLDIRMAEAMDRLAEGFAPPAGSPHMQGE